MMYGNMKRQKKMKGEMVEKTSKRKKANMGRTMYKDGGMYKEDMPKAKPC